MHTFLSLAVVVMVAACAYENVRVRGRAVRKRRIEEDGRG